MKRFVKLIAMAACLTFGAITFGSIQPASASITKSDNVYTVTSGDDLFNLLSNSNSYWNGNTPPDDMTIKVANDITLPGNNPNLYDKLKNVNVDFQNHKFYVLGAASSVVSIPTSSSAQLTISNLNESSDSKSNSVSNVPNSSGKGTTSAYLSTYYGILFSSNFGYSGGTKSSNAQVTYNNVTYDLPNDLGYNQPLCTYFIPINFTGNNNFTSSTYGQQVAEIANIKVSSGTTTITGGDGTNKFAGGMIYPYYNHINNDTFNIDVAKNATLNITNKDKSTPMFAFTGVYNPVVINNNGELNLNATETGSTLFGSGTRGVTLNANADSTTNITTAGKAFSNAMSTTKFIGNFDGSSNTMFKSTSATPFDNGSAWGNGSIFNINSGAKILSYSGKQTSGSGLTSSSSAYMPIKFIGQNLVYGFTSPTAPDSIDSYDSNTSKADSVLSFKDTSTNSSKINPTNNQAFLIKTGLSIVDLGAGNYNWNYNLSDIKLNQPLARTSGDNVNFKVLNPGNQSFTIGAAYSPTQASSPYSLCFKNGSTETDLNDSNQQILSSSEMDNSNGIYSKSFGLDSGLLMKLNSWRGGSFDGKITWTFSKTP